MTGTAIAPAKAPAGISTLPDVAADLRRGLEALEERRMWGRFRLVLWLNSAGLAIGLALELWRVWR